MAPVFLNLDIKWRLVIWCTLRLRCHRGNNPRQPAGCVGPRISISCYINLHLLSLMSHAGSKY